MTSNVSDMLNIIVYVIASMLLIDQIERVLFHLDTQKKMGIT